ncbi:MAG: hypothetical protein JWP63_33 [Candidatus Solibacter sp.]|nr:hypothetical protein [Candidatus Solibacter sp.]
MRDHAVWTLLLLLAPPAVAQSVPAGWKIVKDAKSVCQIAIPPEWDSWKDSSGAAVFKDPSTAIAVVTNQPGQIFKSLTDTMVRMLGIPKDKLFENTAKRLFYQDRTSGGVEEPNAYSASAPADGSTCSCRIAFLPSIDKETAKKIVLSLGPATTTGL